MKIYDFTCLYPYRPNNKNIIPALIAAGASVANTVLQHNENEYAREYNSQEAQKARDYSTYLMQNGAVLKASGMRQAGLNPAFENGAQMGSVPSTPSAPTSPNTIQPLDPLALSNVALMSAKARKDNADAENQEIENARKQAEDETYSQRYFDPNEHIEIADLDSWLQEHPGQMPEMVRVSSKGAKGRFDAKREVNKYRDEVSKVNANVVKNTLEQMVSNQQIKDPFTVLALSKIPEATYNKLLQDTKTMLSQSHYYDSASGKFKAEEALIKLEEKLKNDNNIMPYIDKAFSGDFSLKDLAKVLMLGIMGASSRVSVRF